MLRPARSTTSSVARSEAFVELARGPTGPAAVLRVLTDFARLTPEQITAAAADRPLPRPLVVAP